MEHYSLLREFADSWALLVMAIFFVAMLIWPFVRPNARTFYEDPSQIPFRHEDKPAPEVRGGEIPNDGQPHGQIPGQPKEAR